MGPSNLLLAPVKGPDILLRLENYYNHMNLKDLIQTETQCVAFMLRCNIFIARRPTLAPFHPFIQISPQYWGRQTWINLS
jgi:hypothetical protein